MCRIRLVLARRQCTCGNKQQPQQSKMLANRRYDALETGQASLYRQKFAVIAVALPLTSSFQRLLCVVVRNSRLDQVLGSLRNSSCWREDRQCDDALQNAIIERI